MAAAPTLRRWIAAAGAVAGWSALLLQLWLIVFHPLVDTIPVGGRIVNYFSFFTVLTNILVALALTQTAFAKPGAPTPCSTTSCPCSTSSTGWCTCRKRRFAGRSRSRGSCIRLPI